MAKTSGIPGMYGMPIQKSEDILTPQQLRLPPYEVENSEDVNQFMNIKCIPSFELDKNVTMRGLKSKRVKLSNDARKLRNTFFALKAGKLAYYSKRLQCFDEFFKKEKNILSASKGLVKQQMNNASVMDQSQMKRLKELQEKNKDKKTIIGMDGQPKQVDGLFGNPSEIKELEELQQLKKKNNAVKKKYTSLNVIQKEKNKDKKKIIKDTYSFSLPSVKNMYKRTGRKIKLFILKGRMRDICQKLYPEFCKLSKVSIPENEYEYYKEYLIKAKKDETLSSKEKKYYEIFLDNNDGLEDILDSSAEICKEYKYCMDYVPRIFDIPRDTLSVFKILGERFFDPVTYITKESKENLEEKKEDYEKKKAVQKLSQQEKESKRETDKQMRNTAIKEKKLRKTQKTELKKEYAEKKKEYRTNRKTARNEAQKYKTGYISGRKSTEYKKWKRDRDKFKTNGKLTGDYKRPWLSKSKAYKDFLKKSKEAKETAKPYKKGYLIGRTPKAKTEFKQEIAKKKNKNHKKELQNIRTQQQNALRTRKQMKNQIAESKQKVLSAADGKFGKERINAIRSARKNQLNLGSTRLDDMRKQTMLRSREKNNAIIKRINGRIAKQTAMRNKRIADANARKHNNTRGWISKGVDRFRRDPSKNRLLSTRAGVNKLKKKKETIERNKEIATQKFLAAANKKQTATWGRRFRAPSSSKLRNLSLLAGRHLDNTIKANPNPDMSMKELALKQRINTRDEDKTRKTRQKWYRTDGRSYLYRKLYKSTNGLRNNLQKAQNGRDYHKQTQNRRQAKLQKTIDYRNGLKNPLLTEGRLTRFTRSTPGLQKNIIRSKKRNNINRFYIQ